MLPVADMDTVILKVLRRLEAIGAEPSTTITFGWDGRQIAANLGDYNKLTKSLPLERVIVQRGHGEDEVASAIRIVVARLQLALKGKTGKCKGRKPRGGHIWRAQARRDGVARGGNGE